MRNEHSVPAIVNVRAGNYCVGLEHSARVENIRSSHMLLSTPMNRPKGTIDRLTNVRAGFLVIRNMKINRLENFRGKRYLENSEIAELVNHRGPIYLKNLKVSDRVNVKDVELVTK